MQTLQTELTFRAIILGIVLAIILAASNTYLALKIGMLTSASIPAAVVSMGILRFFKRSSILENNLVQTAASAGEAIAGGVVYTLPALIIIHYIDNFSYWHTFFIALIGGILGILFSVPLRRILIQDKHLYFPEAQAITKILQIGLHEKSHLSLLLKSGFVGGCIEFLQSGLQVVSSSVFKLASIQKTYFGFGMGFSATLIGAGYLIGFNIGLSLLIGAIAGYLFIMPSMTHLLSLSEAQDFMQHDLRFIGIGSMLTAGILTLALLLKPIVLALKTSIKAVTEITEQDIPLKIVLIGLIVTSICAYLFLHYLLPFQSLGFSLTVSTLICLAFILVFGFIFAAICGYFSGMVGVSASPGSAIVIGGLLIAAFSLRALLKIYHIPLTHDIILNACAIVIVLIAVVTGIACITNDNIQDLKVGQLVGSTPYKQQLMLFIGVIAASLLIPPLMQLLYSVYGIGGVYPHPNMDPTKMLPAPVPAVLATMTQAVFDKDLPFHMLFVGAGLTISFAVIKFALQLFKPNAKVQLSILGFAMGLYFPLSTTTALFMGCLFSLFFKSRNGYLSACGLVSGAALMDVLLAIPFAISGNPDILNILPSNMHNLANVLGFVSILFLGVVFFKIKKQSPDLT